MPDPIPTIPEADRLRAYAAERGWPLTDLTGGYFQAWPFGKADESLRCTIIVRLVGWDAPDATPSISAHGDDECAEVVGRILTLRDAARAMNAWLRESQRRPSNEPVAPPSDDGPALPEVPLGVDAQLERAPRDGNEVAAEADTMAHRQGVSPLDHAAIIAAPPAMNCDDEIDDLDADAFCVDNHCGECGEFESECTCDEAGS